MDLLLGCRTCGLVQRVPEPPPGLLAVCARCGQESRRNVPEAPQPTLALTVAGLVLYGVTQLFSEGHPALGTLVLWTSILTPALKLAGVLVLSLTAGSPRHRELRMKLYGRALPWGAGRASDGRRD